MINEPRKFLWALFYLIAFTVTTFLIYGENFVYWMDHIPGAGEDGAKNFYTVAYHILHDSSLFWFEGMNYPYGEHVLYTDNQPIITNILKIIGGSVTWLPFLIFLSALTGGYLFFLMLKKETGQAWFALVASLSIIFLSPQWGRLSGHYSLAYVGLIPILIYLLWKHHRQPNLVRNITMLCVVYCFGWIHPYLLMMSGIFWFLSASIGILVKQARYRWHDALWPIGTVLLFVITLKLSDSITDRPESPYGFINYSATWASIFLPLGLPYFDSFKDAFTPSQERTFYIGLTAIIGTMTGVIYQVKKRSFDFWSIIMLASIPLVLLSVAFPFYLPKLDRLLVYLGPLKQFRGIARFVFPAFYALNLFAVIGLARWFATKKRTVQISGLIVVSAVLIFESIGHSISAAQTSRNGDALNSYEEAAIDPDQFQCILPLPYFHIGSETYRTQDNEFIRLTAFELSLRYGIPLAAVQMSRTSLSQTLAQLSLTKFNTDLPKVLDDYDARPILVIVPSDILLNQNEAAILQQGKTIGRINNLDLYALTIPDFKRIANRNRDFIINNQDSAQVLTSSMENYLSFDELTTENPYAGQGAFEFEKSDWTEIFPQEMVLRSETEYELTFWFNISAEQAANAQLWYWERDGDEEIIFTHSEVGDHIEQINGDWILCSLPFEVESDGNRVSVLIHRDGKKQKLTIDEVLVRAKGELYSRQGNLNLNNRYLTQPN